MDNCIQLGWKNITNHDLVEVFQIREVTELRDPGLRLEVSPYHIFRRIINDNFIDNIATATNALFHLEKQGKQGPRDNITRTDILLLFSMFVDVCGKGITEFNKYRDDASREIGLTSSRYTKVRHHLSYDTIELCKHFNEGIQSVLEVIY